jgi:hypothetical protein
LREALRTADRGEAGLVIWERRKHGIRGIGAHRVQPEPGQAYAQKLLAAGIAATDDDRIFPEADEYAWHPRRAWIPDVFSAAFYYRVSKSGLRKVSFHGLRHSYASIALRAGVPLKVVSDALGHTSVKTTGDLYTEVLGDLQRDAANRIDDIFERAKAKRSS